MIFLKKKRQLVPQIDQGEAGGGKLLSPKVTITNRRITNAIPLKHLHAVGISLDDRVEITYTTNGKYAMISAASNGLKLDRQNESPTVYVRLTNKPDIYPDFMRIHDSTDADSLKLIGDQVQYDKENKRIAFRMVKLG